MAAAGAYLRTRPGGYLYWCPGCRHAHWVNVDVPERPRWTFNGELAAPTFNPSVRVFVPAAEATERHPARPEITLCHHFVRDGMIEFLGDCEHPLAGQTVPMVPTAELVDYGWGDD